MSDSLWPPWTITCQSPLSMGFFTGLEWVAICFSRGSFPPSDENCVSCIADGFFTCCATRGAPTHRHLSSVQKPGMLQNILHTKHRPALHNTTVIHPKHPTRAEVKKSCFKAWEETWKLPKNTFMENNLSYTGSSPTLFAASFFCPLLTRFCPLPLKLHKTGFLLHFHGLPSPNSAHDI